MTTKKKLEEYILKGYKPKMVILERTYEDFKGKAPESWKGKKIYALPLNGPSGDKIMFPFIDEDTLQYAKFLVEDAKTIIGYDLCIYCGLIGKQVIRQKLHLDEVIDKLRQNKGWDVKKSKDPNIFEINFQIKGDDKDLIKKKIEEVEQILLILSIKNEIGFSIVNISEGPKYKSQPFSFKGWWWNRKLKGLNQDDLNELTKITKNENCEIAIMAMADLYSQISDRSKIILAWSIIEDLFKEKSEPIFKDPQKKELRDYIYEFQLEGAEVDDELNHTLYKAITQSYLFKKKTRNEIIADNISKLLDEDYDDIYQEIRDFSQNRGSYAHSISLNANAKQHLDFTKKVLNAYLNKHCNSSLLSS